LNRSIPDFWLTNSTLLPSSWKLEVLFSPSPLLMAFLQKIGNAPHEEELTKSCSATNLVALQMTSSRHFLSKYLLPNRQSANCRLPIGDWELFSCLFNSGFASLGIRDRICYFPPPFTSFFVLLLDNLYIERCLQPI
jgi:hypothetical protein